MAAPSSSPLAGRSRADLAVIGRELMLAAHLQDRAAIPTVLRHHPMQGAYDIAIDEWMTASPLYTRRMQRLLGFQGDDLSTIFKGLQLDVGFPHQFMDVGYRLLDATHGEFWLRSCGALADVIPMGDDMVRGMCHDIEDPTFDATAVATNPRAQVRPVHRPPGIPMGGPDCHWTVTIDESADPVEPHPELASMARSVVAGLPNDPAAVHADGQGRDGYDGSFDPDFELEHLSHRALQIALREFAIQGHLLARAVMTSVDRRHGPEQAIEVGRAVFVGVGWIASERLARALGVERGGNEALLTILRLTHLLLPEDYVGVSVAPGTDGTVVLELHDDALGFTEGDPYCLAGLLELGGDDIISALIHGVDPSADVEASGSGRSRRWTVTPGALEPNPEPPPVGLVRFSTGVEVALRRRVPVPD